jgi:putative glutamine amidotransferase
MTLPRIGITTGYKDGVQSVDHTYIQAIEKAGGLPIIVPMLDSAEHAQAFAQLLDGLVIVGGPGITRGLIGDLPEDLPSVDVVRDTSDEHIFKAMSQQPILGICYGMQFINAMQGGTIYADLTQQVQVVHQHSPKRGAEPHPIQIESESHLGRIMGQVSMTVNTYHIQAVAQVGEGLRVVAKSDDGVVEAFESADARLLGLQFHPERMYDEMASLFRDFIERCRQRKEA